MMVCFDGYNIFTASDENDNAPAFPLISPMHVAENAPIGHPIGTVTANDVDAGTSLRYGLIVNKSANNAAAFFSIDGVSGVVYLNRKLDREQQPLYRLHVEATDEKHNVDTFIDIVVDDINDNQVGVLPDSPCAFFCYFFVMPHFAIYTYNIAM